ncbi:MAG: hypothetical protein G5663_05560 [Serratia symbiotica]|nr:hypothetical protein [Serratia symbiotica]
MSFNLNECFERGADQLAVPLVKHLCIVKFPRCTLMQPVLPQRGDGNGQHGEYRLLLFPRQLR